MKDERERRAFGDMKFNMFPRTRLSTLDFRL